MRTNLENIRAYEPLISGLRYTNVVLAISQTQVIPNDGPSIWAIDGGAADRTVKLPSLSFDKHIVIANMGTTNNLNVTDSAGVAVATITPLFVGLFFAVRSQWVHLLSQRNDVVTPTVIVASGNVLATDVDVQVNGAGVVVLTLPLSTAWASSSGGRGLPLSIFDISGNASVNNITINTTAGQTISGLASLTINTDYGGFRLRPKSGGGWIVE